MTKFIVREKSGEFYKGLVADDIGSAKYLLWFDGLDPSNYDIEAAPKAEAQPVDWAEDFNSPMSHYHY